MVCVNSGELNKPKLYIKKRNSETYHIIPISIEMVIDLFSKSIHLYQIYFLGMSPNKNRNTNKTH